MNQQLLDLLHVYLNYDNDMTWFDMIQYNEDIMDIYIFHAMAAYLKPRLDFYSSIGRGFQHQTTHPFYFYFKIVKTK